MKTENVVETTTRRKSAKQPKANERQGNKISKRCRLICQKYVIYNILI